jgi:hypothetical protein
MTRRPLVELEPEEEEPDALRVLAERDEPEALRPLLLLLPLPLLLEPLLALRGPLLELFPPLALIPLLLRFGMLILA